ncbi:NOL1/NOP2/sun family putative RNA methylase [Candidatus Woesearchaeota archaeon]|nr:NOL1/NOP2/sun family putative RNA methylase [Candidatus Woesearchaeota archaeon]
MIKPIPNTDQIKIKPEFEQRYKKLLEDRYEEFIKYSLSFLRRSIRVNKLKKSVPYVKKKLENQGWKLIQIPWCKHGYWIEHARGRRDIGNTREHALGYFYVQEAASMIPPIVLKPKPQELVLDMCAAPGSKTTQIGEYMKNKGILIANDYQGSRLRSLGINTQRIGLTNTLITKMYGQAFKKNNILFDRILLDAPCSGTGTIRKSIKTLRIWNPTMITRLSHTQKTLIESAYESLKPQGLLVYSTCSNEPEENEEVVDHLLEKYPDAKLEKIMLDVKRSPLILEFKEKKYSQEIKRCVRLWPQDNDTEGFFIAKIRKSLFPLEKY